MSDKKQSQEGLLELEESLYPAQCPPYNEVEPSLLLNVELKLWNNGKSVKETALHLFNISSSVDEASNLALEKSSRGVVPLTKYVYVEVPGRCRRKRFTAVGDQLRNLGSYFHEGETMYISDVPDFERRMRNRHLKWAAAVFAVLLVYAFVMINIYT